MLRYLSSSVLLIAVAGLAYGGQAPENNSPVPVPPGTVAPGPGAAAKSPPEQGEFVIGPEDILLIRVLHEPELSGQQEVRPDGYISLAMVGEIKASEHTLTQLSDAIREKLLKLMRDPQVDVQLVRVNSRKFTIQGEVNRPGTYTFATPPTVLEALVHGMGFRDFANEKKIYILRQGKKIPFNYKEASRGKHMDQNILIQNGDQIFVP